MGLRVVKLTIMIFLFIYLFFTCKCIKLHITVGARVDRAWPKNCSCAGLLIFELIVTLMSTADDALVGLLVL